MNLNVTRAGLGSDNGATSVQIAGDVVMIERAFDEHFAIARD